MPYPVVEFMPKKKSRAPKIVAQILSTLFTAVMVIGFIACVSLTPPKYIPFEEVNLYNTNFEDVYELKDLRVVSKYSEDEDFDYYLVLLPYKDETVKAASFRCSKVYFEDENRIAPDFGKTDFSFTVGVTIDTVEYLYDYIIADYSNAVDDLKKDGINVVSTELDFTWACEANEESFNDYCDIEKSAYIFSSILSAVLLIAGAVLMIMSFKERNTEAGLSEMGYAKQNGVYFDPDFDNRF